MHDICRALNSTAWPIIKNISDEWCLEMQLNAISRIHKHFDNLPCLSTFSVRSVIDGYIEIVLYAQRYYQTKDVSPIELWANLIKLGAEKANWKEALLITELCRCIPMSNAMLERFFSHMKIVKCPTRTSLSSTSLNASLRIRLTGPTLIDYHNNLVSVCVNFWYNSKDRRVNQKIRKTYARRRRNYALQWMLPILC